MWNFECWVHSNLWIMRLSLFWGQKVLVLDVWLSWGCSLTEKSPLPTAVPFWWALMSRLLGGAFPLALILCLKASIKATYTENRRRATQGRGAEKWIGAFVLFAEETAEPPECPSASLPLSVIPCRSTLSVLLYLSISSTCLFTYSPSSSTINLSPPHRLSLSASFSG